MEKRGSERLLSEPESSSEYFALLEKDRKHSRAPEPDASAPSIISTPPSLVAHSLQDDDGNNRELGPWDLTFQAGTSISPYLRRRVLCFLLKRDGNGPIRLIRWFVCSIPLLVRN